MLRKLGAIAATIFAVSGVGFGIAMAASAGDTGTNISCATATATTPDHTVGVDGTDVDTITGATTTAADCETQTYTIPTVTETDTATVTQTVTTPPATSSTSSTTSSTPTTSTTTTSTTTAPPPPPPTGSGCFQSPRACGFPDPASGNVGVPAGTTLTPSGSITVKTAGTVIDAMDVTGQITIQASNVTVQDTRVSVTDGSGFLQGNGPASSDIVIGLGAGGATVTGTRLLDDTLTNAPGTTVQHAVYDGVPGGSSPTGTVADGIYVRSQSNGSTAKTTCNQTGNGNVATNTGGVDSLWWGPGTIKNSYDVAGLFIACDHIENVYQFAGDPLDIEHSVLLNPVPQTANVFSDGKGGATKLTINDSLLAGGGFSIYGDANLNPTKGTEVVTNNRFARCETTMVNGAGGTHLCQAGSDASGYYPKSGSFGVHTSDAPALTWSANVWDDNGATLAG